MIVSRQSKILSISNMLEFSRELTRIPDLKILSPMLAINQDCQYQVYIIKKNKLKKLKSF